MGATPEPCAFHENDCDCLGDLDMGTIHDPRYWPESGGPVTVPDTPPRWTADEDEDGWLTFDKGKITIASWDNDEYGNANVRLRPDAFAALVAAVEAAREVDEVTAAYIEQVDLTERITDKLLPAEAARDALAATLATAREYAEIAVICDPYQRDYRLATKGLTDFLLSGTPDTPERT